ncbi:MAG: hypothetical protein AB7O26_11305 [Planctomycetaceae bacterium]
MRRSWFVTAFCVCAVIALDTAFAEEPRPDAKPAQLGELAKPFKIAMELKTEEKTVQVDVFFVGDSAVEMDPEDPNSAAAIYDLKNLSWYDVAGKNRVTIADCEKWAASSLKRSQNSLRRLEDPQQREFLSALYVPRLKVTEPKDEKNELVVNNAVVEYRITSAEKHALPQRNRYFIYDRLNAYRKAFVNKAPPFAQLELDRILESREVFPGTMATTIKSPYAEVRLDTKMRLIELTADEERKITEAIARAQANP